jgi:enterobactin synthetase component D
MLAGMTDMFPRARDPDVFPPGVAQFSVTIPADVAAARRGAGVELPAALENAAPKRKIQFLAGRLCARAAIGRLAPNPSDGALPRDADGCPVWPAGFVGSIAHAEAFATAAVALCGAARGLGVDVEPVMSEAAAREIARLVASEDETRRVARAASLAATETLTLIF